MANSNQKYQNGLLKREAVRVAERDLLAAGAFISRSPEYAAARLGGSPRFLLDTNVMFGVVEYWGSELRRVLRALLHTQPSLRLHLLDVVSSECRGQTEARRQLWEEVVFDGRNGERALVWPLRSDTRAIEALTTQLRAAYPPERPSDFKDAIIAAAAIGYELGVITRNGADFERYRSIYPALRVYTLPGREAELRINSELLRLLGSAFVS